MKTIIYILLFVILSQTCLAQSGVGIDNNTNQLFEALNKMGGLTIQQQVTAFIKKSPKKIVGSYHLFDSWKNEGIVYINSSKGYKINNINLNIKDSRLESQVGKDSIFTFDFNNIESVVINSRKFKRLYSSKTGSNVIFEIIFEGDSFSVLKKYTSDVKRNEVDPLMLKPNVDEYIMKSSYYILKNNTVEKFILKKKSILSILDSHENEIIEYVKKNNLSFKRDEDIKKIFLHWKTLNNLKDKLK